MSHFAAPGDFRAFDRAGSGFEHLGVGPLLLILPALLAMNSSPEAETEMASTATTANTADSRPPLESRCAACVSPAPLSIDNWPPQCRACRSRTPLVHFCHALGGFGSSGYIARTITDTACSVKRKQAAHHDVTARVDRRTRSCDFCRHSRTEKRQSPDRRPSLADRQPGPCRLGPWRDQIRSM